MIDPAMHPADYHAHPALNASTLKMLAQHPPAKVRHMLDHRQHSSAFDVGTATHSLILEGDDAAIRLVSHPDYRSKAARDLRDEAYAEGAIPLLDHEYSSVRCMRDAVMKHPDAGRLFNDHYPEVSFFGDLYGTECKARMDAWLPDRNTIVDLKTTVDANPANFDRIALRYGYHQQAAHYSDLMEAEAGETPRFLFVLVEKSAPHLVSVVELSSDFVDLGRMANQEAAETYKHAKESGEWPGFEGVTTIIPPVWAMPLEGEWP